MKKVFGLVFSLVLLLGVALAQESGGAETGGAMMDSSMADQTIADILSSRPEFSTLVSALTTAGLLETLQGAGPYTVFAPTNAAFDKLPAGQLDSMMSNPDQLTSLLTYHVASGMHSASSLTGMASPNLTTLEGSDLTIGGGMMGGESGGAMMGESGGSETGGAMMGETGGAMMSESFRVDNATATGAIEASNGIIYSIDTVLVPASMSSESGGG